MSLAGCAGALVTPTVSESGDPRYRIECSGEFSSWDDCQAKADQVCLSKGYSVIASSLEKAALGDKAGNGRVITISCRK